MRIATDSMNRQTLAYFLCSRKANTCMVAFSILASCIGGTATLAMITLASAGGWPAFWWLGSGALGLGLLGLLLAKKIRATRAATLPEIAGLYLGPKSRQLAAIIVIASNIAIIAAQFNAIGVLLSMLAGFDFTISVITGSIIILAYTCIGGQKAVMKSDIWQFAVLAISLWLILIYLLARPECRAYIIHTPLEIANPIIPPIRILYFILVFGSSFLIGPMLFGRLLSARSQATAKTASFCAAFGMALMAALITLIGIGIAGLGLGENKPETLIPVALNLILPDWGLLIVILGLMAAVISSADSCLLSAAMVWSNDLHKNGDVKETRIAMALIALASCVFVFSGKSILDLLLAASDIYVAGMVAPLFICLVAHRRPLRAFGMSAICCGGFCGLLGAIYNSIGWSFAGLGFSFCITLAGIMCHVSIPVDK